jgi:hypothetical protein
MIMRVPALLRRLLHRNGKVNMIQIFTPTVAAERSIGIKLALAGATVLSLSIAGAVAAGAFVTLLLAVGVIYFLVTQVLGIRLDVDPNVIVQQAQKYAQTVGTSPQ